MGSDYRVKCCPDGLVSDRRRRVKVLDCTIRDGGICNDWHFDHPFVARVFKVLTEARVDYMEVGYLSSEGEFDRRKVGPWRFCDPDDLHKVVEPGKIKLCAMLDCHRADPSVIPDKSSSVLDVIRIATYAKDMDQAMRLLDRSLENGYETFINLMAVSTLTPEEVDRVLQRLANSGVHNVAIVDSFGSLFPYHVSYLVHLYMNALGEKIKVGVHLHNNQQQAFANTITAIDAGVDFVDATIHGMGRGAGNCPLELLLFYLDNPRYDVRPVLDLVDDFAHLRDELRFGYHLPYAITGYYNIHPDIGIKRMSREDRYECLEMYESLSNRLPMRVPRAV